MICHFSRLNFLLLTDERTFHSTEEKLFDCEYVDSIEGAEKDNSLAWHRSKLRRNAVYITAEKCVASFFFRLYSQSNQF